VSTNKCGHSDPSFLLQNTIKDLNLSLDAWYCAMVEDLISFSIIGLKYIVNKVDTIYEVDT